MPDARSSVLETTTAERPATGFVFTEGPLWHPDGFFYCVDIRRSELQSQRAGLLARRAHPVRRLRGQRGQETTGRAAVIPVSRRRRRPSDAF